MTEVKDLTRKDFVSDQTVRWCPGCGDYAILAQMQKVLPELGIPRENIVFISGIGCSSRFPYYMNTYGIHSIHGRAPTLATGLKVVNPELSVWVITGDGDGLSIGGNHLIHILRRNVDVNILLFNNRIYGLTKGQYSPTSPKGKKTKSSPMGSIDNPLNPISLAIAVQATFVARTIDTNVKHMAEVLKRAAAHKGTSFVEIYQNCVIFNDKTWSYSTDSKVRDENVLVLEHGQPMVFGQEQDKGIRTKGLDPEIVSLGEVSREELLVHDEKAPTSRAYFLSRMRYPAFPEPIGVFRCVEEPVYEAQVLDQVEEAVSKKGRGDLRKLYHNADTWEVFAEPDRTNGHQKPIEQAILPPSEFDEKYVGGVPPEPEVEESLLDQTLIGLKSEKLVTASPGASLAEAIAELQAANADLLAVVDEAGKLTGVFTGRDVLSKIACQVEDLAGAQLADHMTADVAVLQAGATIADALQIMSTYKTRHVPVVDGEGRPEGVISFRSVIRYMETQFAANG